MLKSYSSRGGILPTDNYSVDKRAFPFSNETVIDATVKESRYERIPTRSALLAQNGSGIMEFMVDPTSDGSMWDLHNSPIIFTFTLGTANTYGLSQFASNQLVTDCEVTMGSQPVNDQHVNLYGYSAFVKDVLMRSRPSILSVGQSLASAANAPVAFSAGGANNSGMESLTEDAIEEGNYLHNPLYQLQVPTNDPANQNSALEFTRQVINNRTIQIKVQLKDSVFMTNKYWPSMNSLRIRVNINMPNLFQNAINAGARTIPTINMVDASFYLKRIFLHQDSAEAFSATLRSGKNLIYTVPYSRIAVFDVPANSSSFNVPQVFSDNFRPDLVCIYTVLNTVNTTSPMTACGGAVTNTNTAPPTQTPYSNNTTPTGLPITDAYIQMEGEYYPQRTAGNNYLGVNQMTCYREYVNNCLVEGEDPYLSWLHFMNHYSVVCINTRKDKAKWYSCAPTESNNGFNLYTTITPTTTAAKMYVVCFNNVHITIDAKGNLTKRGF